MYRHFLSVFFRTAKKDFGYLFVNILGLTLALCCFIFIGLWSRDELTFDSFHTNRENVYQVMGRHRYPDATFVQGGTPGPLAPALKSLSGIEQTCRTNFAGGKQLFHANGKSSYENGMFADASLVDVFTLTIIDGDRTNPLADKSSIIISRKIAHKYFTDKSAVGQILKLNNKLDLTVTAVFEELPDNSSLKFDFVLPYELYATQDIYNNEWGAWTGGFTYVKVFESSDIADIEKQITEKFTKPHIWVRWDTNVDLFLYPMKDWHLYGNFTNGVQDGGRIDYVIIFGAVGIFILLMACINFMNLTIARATRRAKEVGVRKVIGALKASLFAQFMFESLIVVAISTLLSLGILTLTLPALSQLTGKQLNLPFNEPAFYFALSGLTLVATCLAGCYPAMLPATLRTLDVLRGKIHGMKAIVLRKALVAFQFSLSVALIVCAFMAKRQIEFFTEKSLGINRHSIIYFNSTEALAAKRDAFKTEAMKNPIITVGSEANANPMDVQQGMVLADNAWPGKQKEDNIVFGLFQCDPDFIPALGFTIIDGRNFSNLNTADSANYIINEEAARQMKLEDPVGQSLAAPHKGTIIGVVKDFHSLKLRF
jgi:hypothetical protein